MYDVDDSKRRSVPPILKQMHIELGGKIDFVACFMARGSMHGRHSGSVFFCHNNLRPDEGEQMSGRNPEYKRPPMRPMSPTPSPLVMHNKVFLSFELMQMDGPQRTEEQQNRREVGG